MRDNSTTVGAMRRLVLLLTITALWLGLSVSATATSGTPAPFVKPQYFDANGNPCNGCQIFVYLSGTSTKTTTYSEATLSSANTNPIVLDSAGRAAIFLTPGTAVKFILAPSTDTDPPAAPYWTVDGVQAIPPSSTAADSDATATAGESLAAGDAVYWSDGSGGLTAGRVYKADADFTYASNLAQATGFATSAISTGSSGTIRRLGRVTGLTGLVAGTTYWASATAGALTSTKPTNARVMGIADSTTSLIVVPQDPDASSTLSGNMSTGAQTIAGAKTISNTMTFAVPPVAAPTYSRCDTTLVKNNNNTLANVSGLAFAVGASEVWAFQFYLAGISSSTADFKFTLTGPAAPTAIRFGVQNPQAATGVNSAAAFGTSVVAEGEGAAPSVDQALILHGLLRNGANAGTVQLQFAQNTNEVADSKIYVESYVLAWRIQ